jgi:hypothetical protein
MDFKKTILLASLFCNLFQLQAQVKKPVLMILPSDNWCLQRYFYTEISNEGASMKVPDYKKAFQEDLEIGQVISKIGSMMIENGFPLKDAENEIKNAERQITLDDAITNGVGKNQIRQSLLDRMISSSKTDILVQIWWVVNKKSNGEKVINFTIEAIDTYTSKRISASTGSSTITNSNISTSEILIQEIQNKLTLFTNQIQSHFDDLFENGREVKLQFKIFKDWELNLDSEFQGQTLNQIIEDWLQKHTFNSKYNISSYTENFMNVDQVKIPLLDNSNRGVDARIFMRNLQEYLKKGPYNIPSKLISSGLGEATLIIGDK